MFDEVEVDESKNSFDSNIFGNKKSVVLINVKNSQIDEKELGDKLGRLSNLDNIENFQIDYSSRVKNCIFLKIFRARLFCVGSFQAACLADFRACV